MNSRPLRHVLCCIGRSSDRSRGALSALVANELRFLAGRFDYQNQTSHNTSSDQKTSVMGVGLSVAGLNIFSYKPNIHTLN